jgi:hypothetical protein
MALVLSSADGRHDGLRHPRVCKRLCGLVTFEMSAVVIAMIFNLRTAEVLYSSETLADLQ